MQPIRLESKFDTFSPLLEIPDFDLLIIMAVGSRYHLHDEIAKIYRENRDTYYEWFRKSLYYEDKRLASLSVQNYRSIQQFIGIFLFEQSFDSNRITMKLIKKGYRFVYNFVKNHLKVDFYQLRDQYIDYVKKNVLEKNIHSAHLFGIALYLCRELDKTITFDDFDVNLMNKSIKQVFLEIEAKPEADERTDAFLEQYRKIGIMKKDFSLPLKDLIVSINKLHDERRSQEEDIHESGIDDQLISHDFYKGLSKVALVLQYCNINPLDLQNITNIDQEKMKEIVSLCLSSIEIFQLAEDAHSLLGTYLLIYALATDYNLTKHDLIVTSQEEVQQELFNLKKQYENKIRLIEKEEEQKETRIARLEESNNRLIEKVQELERQLLKKEGLVQEKNEKILVLEDEVDSLHQKIVSLEEPTVEPISESEMAAVLNQKKCVIVGGLKSWQDQLKDWIPSARFIQAEELGIDLDFIRNADIVFFNESVNNHAMYQKIKARLENSSILMSYSGGNTNMKISLRKMYEALMDQGAL